MVKKLSEFRDEKAIDVLAEILEPAVDICSNKNLAEAVRNNEGKLKIAQTMIKDNKKEVIRILAILSEEEEYHCNAITLIADVMTLLNDKELLSFFSSQAPKVEKTSSASALENTEE